jgi:oligopeptide transport system permease protein
MSAAPLPQAALAQPAPPASELRVRGPWQQALRRLRKNRAAMLSLAFLTAMVVLSILSPWIAPYDYDEPSLGERFLEPSLSRVFEARRPDGELVRSTDIEALGRPHGPVTVRFPHLLGTDALGRDLLSRVLAGSQISLAVGFVATLVSLVIGVGYGSAAGWLGGHWDRIMMRAVDALYALPYMIFVILIMVFIENKDHKMRLLALFAALGAVQWLTMARITRGQMLAAKEKEFVEAARALGASAWAIVLRHVLPNLLGPVIVYTTLTVPQVMLQEAFLSFLGLGISAPFASWGTLAADGAQAINPINTRLWLIVPPSLALASTLFALNFLGDGLRDALDPRQAR